ncbi:DEAD/DEAH box helicase [uncultured Kocuria sp.]|uniref:DEAD/DEAH box helicase n=1 Tax=uncultured Kocuria sp. TaxID=259305 RepID=UPI00259A23A0|nr:DEAD/DEAH box helicase [uncultured Kocuria sp.]MCT1366430.1 DEAD/DEAH box helicase [Rothia sp. p3-SID1597]
MPFPAQQMPVSVAHIIKAVGHNAFGRGERYYRAGKVLSAAYDPDSLTFSSKVSGSERKSYSQTVIFPEKQAPHSAPFHSFCSCPVGTNCKHVVAALLGWFHEGGWGDPTEDRPLRSASPTEPSGSQNTSDQAVPDAVRRWSEASGVEIPDSALQTFADFSGRKEATSHRALGDMQSSWRRQMTRALQSQRAYGSGQHHRVPAALDLDVEVPRHRGYGRPTEGVVAPVHLTARPLKLGTRGRWIKGGLHWNVFAGDTVHEPSIPEEHSEWFREFYSVVHPDQGMYASTRDYVRLDQVSSSLLWDLLERASSLGIAILVRERPVVIGLAPESTLDLRIERTDDEGLKVSPGFRFAASPESDDASTAWVPASSAFPLGRQHDPQAYFALGGALHAEYTRDAEGTGSWGGTRPSPIPQLAHDAAEQPWITEDTELLFFPLAERPTHLARSIAEDGEMSIPASEIRDFAEDFYPQVARRTPIFADDDAAPALPEVLSPELILEVEFFSPGRHDDRLFPAAVDWYWLYPQSHVKWPNDVAEDPDAAAEGEEWVRVPIGVGHPDPYREIRDTEREHDVISEVRRALPVTPLHSTELSGWESHDLVEKVIPTVEEIPGTRVVVRGDIPEFTSLDGDAEVQVSVESTGDRDWFDLGVTVKAGAWYVPFVDIFRALDAGQKHLLLGDGSYFRLDRPEFTKLRDLISEARQLQDESAALRINRHQAGLWEDLEELATDVHVADEWRESVQSLLELEDLPQVALPEDLTAILRPYQLEGYQWLSFLYDHRLGGVLADDMGLGKTVQTIAMFLHAFEVHRTERSESATRPRFLVVAPTSVAPNWAREIQRFAPSLSVELITETSAKSRRSVGDRANGADVVITSYALMRLDEAEYRDLGLTGLVLDEAQFIKNAKTKAHRIARDLPARFKLVVTGTPMENDLMELWSMFSIAAPGLFPSARKFRDSYAKPITSGESPEALPRLRQRVRPLMMRRTKELVAAELPEKQEHRIDVPLSEAHRKVYDTRLQRERQKLLGLLQDMDKNRFTIFQSLTMLRRLSLAAGLVDEEHADVESAKLTYLRDNLPEIIQDGHRALVFSQFTSFLTLIAEVLKEEGIPYVYLDGTTRDRGSVVDAFNAGEAPIFLISLKAGGFGLNLTAADYCFIMDPWWNPAAEAQAVDRAHRIGQDRNVMVYRLVSAGTIEEKVMDLKSSKAELFQAVMDEGQIFSSAIGAEEIHRLIEG